MKIDDVRPLPFQVLVVWLCSGLIASSFVCALGQSQEATDSPGVKGLLTVNQEEIDLNYVYAWQEDEGFYDPQDPLFTLLFVDQPLPARDFGSAQMEATWVELRVTKTKEFSEEPEVRIVSQTVRRVHNNEQLQVSGGDDPLFELHRLDSKGAAGSFRLPEARRSGSNTYRYEIEFETEFHRKPGAPQFSGDSLGTGGGKIGEAYLAWTDAVHSGEFDRMKALFPPSMAKDVEEAFASLKKEEVAEELESMRDMTPTEVQILAGSVDGDTAKLEASGELQGEVVEFEVTMTRIEDVWFASGMSFK